MKHLKKALTATLMLVLVLFTSCDPTEVLGKVVADFEFTPEVPAQHQEVTFTTKSLTAESFAWDFGDGNTATGSTVKHIYDEVGEYTVTHTVTNSEGKTASKTKNITVTKTGGGEQPQGAIIKHSKDITADETWSNKYIHIVTTGIEVKNATLTIEPGTLVKFEENAELEFGYSEVQNSKLIAKGTASNHITFTSAKDSPQPGDWDYIYFGEFADESSVMEYCDISYGGGYSNGSGSIHISKKSILFNHNKVTLSSSNGIYCYTEAYFGSFEDNEVSNCQGNAIYMSEPKYVHTLSSLKGVKSRIDDNSLHGIFVYGGNDMYKKGDYTWQNLGARYTIDGTMHVGSAQGTSLTIEAGTTIAFMADADLEIGYQDNKTGKLIAKGTAQNKIKFVSEKVGNSGGNWDYIYFGEFNAEGSILDHCVIEDGGDYSESSAAIRVNNTSITLTNSTVKNSVSNGIFCNYGGRFDAFTGNTVTNSEGNSIKIDAQWAHTIGENNQIDNDLYGIAVYGDFDHKKKTYHWVKQTCPYTVKNSMHIGSTQGCTLIIDAGNRIQIAQDYEIEVGYKDNTTGTLIAQGTKSEKIVFAPATQTGKWDYIYFGQGTGKGSILGNCEIVNGGDYNENSGTIIVRKTQAGEPTLSGCLIKNSQSNGLLIYKNTSPTISNMTYENCAGEDVKNNNYE